MRTVRAKLLALVLACVAPAIVGAVLRSREVKQNMLAQVQRRVDGANRRFMTELEEYQANAKLALAMTEHSTRFQHALATHDQAGAERLVKLLGEVYDHRVILASDSQGQLVVRGGAERGPASLAPDSSAAFAELLAGKALHGLIDVKFADGPGYALVSAEPVRSEGVQVGAIALLTPITPQYLEYLEPKLNADLSVRVNEKVVAACKDHPAPDLESHTEAAILKQVGPKLFALKTFHPKSLQRPNLDVEFTASRDVTELRDAVNRDLYVHLGGLTVLLAVVLALALRFASRMGDSVKSISDAATQVKAGKYVDAPIVHTGDEIEQLALSFNAMVRGLKERDQLKDSFGRYVTRQVADHLLRGNMELGGELIPVTVLFSDIRSFTSISEHMEPRALLDFLNVYFSGMVESVMLHQGVVDKFIGDAIMAVFGAPVPHPDDALNAVKAALEMRARLLTMNELFKARGLPELKTGIGLHSGQVVAGNMGHVERMEYTVIGDAVNLASRLEGMTKELHCDVILSEDLFKQVEAHVDAEPLQKIKVKGRDREVAVYRLIGLKAQALSADLAPVA